MYKIFIFLSLFACYLGQGNIKMKRSRPDGRIVGGVTTEISLHPYQVSLEHYGRHSCGGSIMNNYWVVTAAHCLYGVSPEAIIVRVGSSDRETGGQIHRANTIHVHNNYNERNIDYDIAVIKVSRPFSYDNTVKPIPLATVEPTSGTPVIVSGWGRLQESGPSPTKLQKVQVYVISRGDCDNRYGGNQISQRMICAGVTGGGKDACAGDSGGPLVSQGKLVGVVSWGAGCARVQFPGVYSNVAYLKSWVDYITKY